MLHAVPGRPAYHCEPLTFPGPASEKLKRRASRPCQPRFGQSETPHLHLSQINPPGLIVNFAAHSTAQQARPREMEGTPLSEERTCSRPQHTIPHHSVARRTTTQDRTQHASQRTTPQHSVPRCSAHHATHLAANAPPHRPRSPPGLLHHAATPRFFFLPALWSRQQGQDVPHILQWCCREQHTAALPRSFPLAQSKDVGAGGPCRAVRARQVSLRRNAC